jgi:hypothetical protein
LNVDPIWKKKKKKKRVLFFCRPHRHALSADGVTRRLIPASFTLSTRVVARRDARVRNQQHGRAVCGQRPLREKETFFGDFLPFSKKLPAPWSGSFCSQTPTKAKVLDSRLRGNDEHDIRAGFQLSLE